MAEEEKKNIKPENKKPKFNNIWIYVAIFLVFVGIQFFGGSSWTQPAQTTQSEFESYLKDGDVERVEK